MKEFLSQKGLEFVVKDVHNDPEAQDEMVSMGFAGIPVTVIGDAAPVLGANYQQIESALQD